MTIQDVILLLKQVNNNQYKLIKETVIQDWVQIGQPHYEVYVDYAFVDKTKTILRENVPLGITIFVHHMGAYKNKVINHSI